MRAFERAFKFGYVRHSGLSVIDIGMPVSESHSFDLSAEIFDVHITLLLGLDALSGMRAILDFAEDVLIGKFDGWRVPLVREKGHIYFEWDASTLYTRTELKRMHRQFRHHSAEKLYAVIQPADPLGCRLRLFHDLENVTRKCEVCQRVSRPPGRFRLSLPQYNVVFNAMVCLDLIKVGSRSVLHAVEKATKFGAARSLRSESTVCAWATFDQMWSQTYIGRPDVLSSDRGSVFTSSEWENTQS